MERNVTFPMINTTFIIHFTVATHTIEFQTGGFYHLEKDFSFSCRFFLCHRRRIFFSRSLSTKKKLPFSGLGRSKFLPKPMPPEINMLLAECDRNCHHEYSDTSTASSNKCGGNLETLEDDDDDENRIGWVEQHWNLITIFSTETHTLCSVYGCG